MNNNKNNNKNLLILIVVLGVVCLGVAIMAGQKVSKTNKVLEQERYSRMVAEEKFEKVSTKIKSLETDLAKAQTQAQDLQVTVEKEKSANAKAQTELEKMTSLKEILEKELKNALVPPAPQVTTQPPAGQ